MCLKIAAIPPIPVDTRSLVESVLPGDDPMRIIGERLADFVCDADFADMYAEDGRPATSPALLAMITIFQFMENVSDRVATRFVRTRLDWKYALHLPLDYDGFSHTVLCDFRIRLEKQLAYLRIFNRLLGKLGAADLVSGRGRQRTDSFAVLAAVRTLGRLELVMETLRLALRAVEQVDAGWLWSAVPAEWADYYGDWTQEERLVRERGEKGRAEAKKLGKKTGQDGLEFLAALEAPGAPGELLELPEVKVLREVWEQQYEVCTGECQWREKMVVPSSEVIQTPHDEDARLARHGEKKWTGYQVEVTESVDEDKPRIITDIEVTAATTHDAQTVAGIQERLAERDLLPAKQVVDTNYISAPTLAESQDRGVELVGPARGNANVQGKTEEGIPLAKFALDWDAKQAQCPCGKLSASWVVRKDKEGRDEVHVHFATADCSACPRRGQCMTGKKNRRRGRNLHFSVHHRLLEQRREEQKTDAFKEVYRSRAGIEATGSEMIRAHGLRQARYVGAEKVSLQYVLTGAATNLKRAARWLAGQRRAAVRPRSLRGVAAAAA